MPLASVHTVLLRRQACPRANLMVQIRLCLSQLRFPGPCSHCITSLEFWEQRMGTQLSSKWAFLELPSLSFNTGDGSGKRSTGARKENSAEALRGERSVLLLSSPGSASPPPALAGFLLNCTAAIAFGVLPRRCGLCCPSSLCCARGREGCYFLSRLVGL